MNGGDVLAALGREGRQRGRAAAGCRSPGCACAARRPSAGPARRGRGRRSGPVALEQRAPAPARARSRRKRRPLDRLVVADAEPQRPPRPLVQRRERARAGRLVLAPPRPASTASRRRSSARRGRARCRARRRTSPRRAARAAPSRSAAQPSNRQAASSARRCGSHTRSQSIGGPECSSVRSLEPVDHLARRRDRHARAGARPRCARRAAALAASTRSPCAPQSARAAPRRRRSPPAGGRQSTSTHVGALLAHARRRTPDSPTFTAAQARVQHRLVALASHAPTSPHARRRRPRRARAARQARPRLLDRLRAARRSTATTPPLVPHGDGYLVRLRRGDLARRCSRPTRSRAGAAAVVTNVADVRAMGGRPLALVDTLVSPDRAHAERVLDGLALGGRPARRARRRRPPHARAARRGAVGLLHRRRATRRCARRRARPGDVLLAAFCLEGR